MEDFDGYRKSSLLSRLRQRQDSKLCKRGTRRSSIGMNRVVRRRNKKSVLNYFCDSTSIRGMSKIGRGPRFLRTLWLCFVITMTSLLMAAIVLLIHDFLNYYVSVHTELLLDEKSAFPAITVCHHHPFSQRAYKLWNANKVLSPSKFNQYMRNLTYMHLVDNDVDGANIFNYDSLEIYYQNLAIEDALQLGHPHSIFLNCMRRQKYDTVFDDDCRALEGYKIRRLSNHLFFNCYTFEPDDKDDNKNSTDFLSLIVSLGPKPDYEINEQAFIVDIFQQARGLRVVVHEPGTMPDIEEQGLHVEPGKLNEINYQHVRWKKLNTPSTPCITINESHSFKDLNETYIYQHSQCILLHQQLEVMDKCGCMYIMNPRPQMPSEKMPYCARLMPNFNSTEFMDRIGCISSRLDLKVKRKYDGSVCFPRCSYSKYESTISITKWRAKEWQLHWLRLQNQAHKLLVSEMADYKRKNITFNATATKAFKIWKEYIELKNLTKFEKDKNSELNLEGDNFAYVVLKRKTANTIAKTEKLVLTLYVLLSRIGGLCSLSIGLTAAFAVELVEFFYLYCENRMGYRETGSVRHRHRSENNSKFNNDTIEGAVEIEVNDFTGTNRNGISLGEESDLISSPAFSSMVRINNTREHFL